MFHLLQNWPCKCSTGALKAPTCKLSGIGAGASSCQQVCGMTHRAAAQAIAFCILQPLDGIRCHTSMEYVLPAPLLPYAMTTLLRALKASKSWTCAGRTDTDMVCSGVFLPMLGHHRPQQLFGDLCSLSEAMPGPISCESVCAQVQLTMVSVVPSK